MKTATIKTIEQSEKVGLYSICFDGNDLTEYEKFVQKFDKLLAQELASGKIKIEQNVITGIESATFEL